MDSIYCSAEWHLARISGLGEKLAALIYSLSLRLSKKTGVFSPSIPTLAAYFDVDERTVRSAIKALVAIGFFEIIRKERGAPTTYRPIHHSDWSQKRPGMCTEKAEMPWDGEMQDTLGPELHAISGHRFKVYPNFLKGMRNTGHDDAAIREFFRSFIAEALPTGKQWAFGLAGNFIKYLKSQPISPSNSSQRM